MDGYLFSKSLVDGLLSPTNRMLQSTAAVMDAHDMLVALLSQSSTVKKPNEPKVILSILMFSSSTWLY